MASLAVSIASLAFAACGGDDAISPLDAGSPREDGGLEAAPTDSATSADGVATDARLDAATKDAGGSDASAADASDANEAEASAPEDACRSAQDLGELSTDGGVSSSVDTILDTRLGSASSVSCATSTGGLGAGARFTVTSAADIRIDFEQLGNHALAVFSDSAPPSSCADDVLVGCAPAIGADQNGTQTFVNVPPGAYAVVFVGDQPDNSTTRWSGAVEVRLTSTPHM